MLKRLLLKHNLKKKNPITFGHYLKVGFPTMVLSVAISTVYLLVRFH